MILKREPGEGRMHKLSLASGVLPEFGAVDVVEAGRAAGYDAVCLWVEDRLGPRGYPQTTRLETLSQTRQLDMWFQCEACSE